MAAVSGKGAQVSVQSLTSPKRDGWLTKQGGSVKSWKRRWFVLKGGNLYYFKTKKDVVSTGVITLDNESSVAETSLTKKKNAFEVLTKPRTYVIVADTFEIKKQWMDSITEAVAEIKGGKVPTTVPPPAAATSSASSSTTAAAPAAAASEMAATNPTTPATTANPAGAMAPVTLAPGVEEPMRVATTTAEPIVPGIAEETAAASAALGTMTTTVRPPPNAHAEVRPRQRLENAKNSISFLREDDSRVREFWSIWAESIPGAEELTPGLSVDFTIAISANLQKLQWRTSGPQNLFIQKMVDFFWNVGAPETEIDHLNDVGARINPVLIGSWIDMSAKGGMDGGWFFPVDVSIDLALESSDMGAPVEQVKAWALKHSLPVAYSIGRDMGAAPPRQTEIRLMLSKTQKPPAEQLEIAIHAFDFFDFPPIEEPILQVLRNPAYLPAYVSLSVVTSVEGFVRLGLLMPYPSGELVAALCAVAGGNRSELAQFEAAVGSLSPEYVEIQYLQKGFGYAVYKEGFDVVFHYNLGADSTVPSM